MANDFLRSPLIIDSTIATDIRASIPGRNANSPIKIDLIRWVGGTTATHAAEIQDMDGRVLWTSLCPGANSPENSRIRQWWRGFKVPTLASGKLYIYLSDD